LSQVQWEFHVRLLRERTAIEATELLEYWDDSEFYIDRGEAHDCLEFVKAVAQLAMKYKHLSPTGVYETDDDD
jgi:hypothetical protein